MHLLQRVGMSPNFLLALGVAFLCLGLALGLTALLSLADQTGSTLATSAGAIATAGGVFFALFQFSSTAEAERSRVYLQEAVRGIERAHTLLQDGNNSRVTWILAARILARSKRLANALTFEHRGVFEIVQDDYRIRFHKILRSDEGNVAAFFYGSPRHQEPLEQAAEWQQGQSYPMPIPESALRAVYDFAEYPDDYDDPVAGRFTGEELQKIRLRFRSLHNFIEFYRDHRALPRRRISRD